MTGHLGSVVMKDLNFTDSVLDAVTGAVIGAAVSFGFDASLGVYSTFQKHGEYRAFCSHNSEMREYDDIIQRVSNKRDSPEDMARLEELRNSPAVQEGRNIYGRIQDVKPSELFSTDRAIALSLVGCFAGLVRGMGSTRRNRTPFPWYD